MSCLKCERDPDLREVLHVVVQCGRESLHTFEKVSHVIEVVWERIITDLGEVSHAVKVQEFRHQLGLVITHRLHLLVLPVQQLYNTSSRHSVLLSQLHNSNIKPFNSSLFTVLCLGTFQLLNEIKDWVCIVTCRIHFIEYNFVTYLSFLDNNSSSKVLQQAYDILDLVGVHCDNKPILLDKLK